MTAQPTIAKPRSARPLTHKLAQLVTLGLDGIAVLARLAHWYRPERGGGQMGPMMPPQHRQMSKPASSVKPCVGCECSPHLEPLLSEIGLVGDDAVPSRGRNFGGFRYRRACADPYLDSRR